MIATVVVVVSAAILFALGTLHFIYTFVGTKLTPRDPALQIRMAEVSPVITNETTMWRCWVGFNASHSMAAILFGLIYGARLNWFSIPFIGISISLACYVAGIIAALA